MKILVADDDPVSCRLMQRMLQRDGYEVIVATNGRAASEELCLTSGPKLALVDWMMPELDGLGVCREARQRTDGPYVYIVLLTAKQSHEDIVAGFAAGADDYLTKPCHPAELNARLLTGQRILQLEQKLVEAREDMRFRATHDGLTGLLNRAAVVSQLQESLQFSDDNSCPKAVMICDIDHFKQINDTYGHLAGDAVLVQVSSIIRGAVRSTDLVGRYGGEEFLIVLHGCAPSDLPARAEEVRRRVEETICKTTAGCIRISLSIGAFAIEPRSGLSAERIIGIADKALYEAKNQGRNQVSVSEHREFRPAIFIDSQIVHASSDLLSAAAFQRVSAAVQPGSPHGNA